MVTTECTKTRPDGDAPTEVLGWDAAEVPMSPCVDAFFRYCLDLKANRRAPAVRDFDITALAARDPAVVRQIWILDVERTTGRFRYRLIGAAIQEAGGLAKVGDYADQFDETGAFSQRLRRIVDAREPRYYSGPPHLIHDTFVRTLEILQVPFLGDDGAVARIYNCTIYAWQADRAPRPRL